MALDIIYHLELSKAILSFLEESGEILNKHIETELTNFPQRFFFKIPYDIFINFQLIFIHV